MSARAAVLLLLAGGTALAPVEDDYGALRSLKDQADVAAERGQPADARAYEALRAKVAAGVEHATASTQDEQRALDAMWRALENDLPPRLSKASEIGATSCEVDVAPMAWDSLREHLYACFGAAARSIPVGGETLDRLTVLGRLANEDDPAQRRRLFMALEPVWRAVNSDAGPRSPYRQLVTLLGARVREGRSPLGAELQALGVPADQAESWLLSMLEAWHAASPADIEPWDFWHQGAEASRALDARIPRDRLEAINAEFYRSLGADPDRLRIRYDLLPRPGKTPVAYTTFGSRVRDDGRVWRAGEVAIFATYRDGGLGNLVELLHETGHGIHVAAIRTRAAFADWPDSTTFTEALADVPALEAYEPEWQRRYLGAEAPLAASLRAKFAPVMLDVAWGLFEMRMARHPKEDPNAVWTGITHRYLRIRPHPEWSWWAIRGQLVRSPGYMVHYAVGAVVAADVRARCREQRGPFAKPDPGYYDWLAARLFRHGLERPTREVLADFLGRPIRSDAVLADLARLRRP